MTKRIKYHIPTLISVAATLILLFVTFLWFKDSIDRRVEITNESYLTENTKALSTVFRTKLEDQLVMLESQVRYFEGIDLSDYNAMKTTIMSTKGIGAFKTIGVANAAGATINYNGHSSGNIFLTDFFKEAMNGETSVSDRPFTDEEGQEVLIVCVPIKQKGRSVGVVFGTFGKNILSQLVNSMTFSQRGTNLLLDSDGNILAESIGSDLKSIQFSNLFSDSGVKRPPASKDSITRCVIRGIDTIAVVTPVGVHDWYFASLLPNSVVDEQSEEISGNVAILVLMVSFAFVLLFVSIMYLLKNNDDIIRTNEKFKLVTVESQDIIFDYNVPKQTLTFDGYTDNIISESKPYYDRKDTLGFLELIHSEDAAVKEQFLSVRSISEPSIRGEFRIKCTDGTYSWFRMKATIVRSHDGTVQQLVGSLINVDEQMSKEMRMIEKAETDLLTGIYNKGAFYDHVSQNLRTSSDSDLFAIYIIDLDNFKKVNDDLGHTMGDQVLSDVAKKLCIVFSDKDCVGRIGGDEFAAFLHLSSKARNVGMSIIEEKAKAICSQINETYRAKKKEVVVTASVGVAIYPYAGRDYSTLFRKADRALYKVKGKGKNSYNIYSSEDDESSSNNRK